MNDRIKAYIYSSLFSTFLIAMLLFFTIGGQKDVHQKPLEMHPMKVVYVDQVKINANSGMVPDFGICGNGFYEPWVGEECDPPELGICTYGCQKEEE